MKKRNHHLATTYIGLGILFGVILGLLLCVNTTAEFNEDGEVYFYYYPPDNSFGMTSFRTLNTSYIEGFYNKYVKEIFNASFTNTSGSWHNASEGLTTNINWTINNNTGNISCKTSYIINTSTAPESMYYRLIWGIDKRCVNFINGTIQNHSVTFDIPNLGMNNDTVTFTFDYSDVIPLIQNGQVFVRKGVKTVGNQTFVYWKIQTVNQLPVGITFEIDPTFGETDPTVAGYYGVDGEITGSNFICPTSGTADSLTVRIRVITTSHNCSGLIYDASENLLGQAEVKIINVGGVVWATFNFSEPKPNLIGGNEYNLTFWQNTTGTAIRFYYNNTGLNVWNNYTALTGAPPPDPILFNLVRTNRHMIIYCSYTELPPPPFTPEINYMFPNNNSINICPCCAILSINVFNNGSNFNISVLSNVSGIWNYIGINFTSYSDGNHSQIYCDFVFFNRDYYWKTNVTDYSDNSLYNESPIYKFSTTSDVNCSVGGNTSGYSKVEADDIFMSDTINVEPEFLFLSIWFFLFFVWWKSESEDLTDYMAILFLPYTIFLCAVILPSYIAEIESEYRWLTYFIFIAVGIIVTVYSYEVMKARKK